MKKYFIPELTVVEVADIIVTSFPEDWVNDFYNPDKRTIRGLPFFA